MIVEGEAENFEVFRDCLSTTVIEKLVPRTATGPKKRAAKGRKNGSHPAASDAGNDEVQSNDAAELSDFVEYLAEEIFSNLSDDLRTLSYAIVQDKSHVAEKFSVPLDAAIPAEVVRTLPPDVSDSLCSYGLLQEPSDLDRFLDPVLTAYISTCTAAPPQFTPAITASRPSDCEICEREHVPLTYHHLIPRQAHPKALKRGWHKEWELNKVAWLCRACHSFVHRIATNDELARDLYDVDLLLEREDVRKFATWVGRVRWKAR